MPPKKLTAKEVADYLIWHAHEHGDTITNLKLQKLLYYAQGWHLALYGRPLFDDEFEAWVHGPVVPSQYRRFSKHKWEPIPRDIAKPSAVRGATREFIDEVVGVFGAFSAFQLERMTHREPPWLLARKDLAPDENSSDVISKDSMKKYFKKVANE